MCTPLEFVSSNDFWAMQVTSHHMKNQKRSLSHKNKTRLLPSTLFHIIMEVLANVERQVKTEV